MSCTEGGGPGQPDQSQRSSKTQSPSNHSSIQQQFAFAAGLAAAADMPVASADPSNNPQLSQPYSAAGLDKLPSQQDQQLPQDSNQQSASQSSPESAQGRAPQAQQDQRLDPWSEPDQPTQLSQQQVEQSQPDEDEKLEPEPSLTTSASASSNDSNTGSAKNGTATAGADESSTDAEAEVVDIEQMSFQQRIQAGLDCFRQAGHCDRIAT